MNAGLNTYVKKTYEQTSSTEFKEQLENNKTYYGIIDTKKNKVVFNTDEEILTYVPYSDFSMLAITSNTAYEICIIKKDGICIDSSDCPYNNYILDINENRCSLYGIGKIFLLREGICNDTCDESIYISNGYECGLCKQLYPSTPYKLINSSMFFFYSRRSRDI